MALIPGSRLGSHDIVALLGVGGMGEVYRATDTNLKRQVAIKVLPTSVAADADRLARFQREAELLAALNHPNIAHIHGLEKSNFPKTGADVVQFAWDGASAALGQALSIPLVQTPFAERSAAISPDGATSRTSRTSPGRLSSTCGRTRR